MSDIATDMPDVVECLNPRVLNLSASSTVLFPPDTLKVVSINSSVAFFVIKRLTKSKGTSFGITSKINALPTVVSSILSLILILIFACISI